MQQQEMHYIQPLALHRRSIVGDTEISCKHAQLRMETHSVCSKAGESDKDESVQ